MRLRTLGTFKKDYQGLTKEIQQQVDEALRLLSQNPRHPSLQVKKMKGTKNIWEGRVTLGYRFTFNWEADLVILRRVGTHDVLTREK